MITASGPTAHTGFFRHPVPRDLVWLMSQEKKNPQPDIDVDAEAKLALSEARAMPPGAERSEAMKKAGISFEMPLPSMELRFRSGDCPTKIKVS